MIEITRRLAGQVRAVFRKALGGGRNAAPCVVFQAGSEGLRVRASHNGVAVEYASAGPMSADTLVLPLQALQDFEGRKDARVVLEQVGAGRVQVSWQDAGLPQVREYDAVEPDRIGQWPAAPDRFSPAATDFLRILADGVQCVARDSIRYALTRLQLRGDKGQVVATDGRQLLVQSACPLPWQEGVLVPALVAFGCRELPPDEQAQLGKTDSHVWVRAGPWTFVLPIDRDGRFPPAENVIPGTNGKTTLWRLSQQDAAFLGRALAALPDNDDETDPVTLDLDRHGVVRTRPAGGRVTEIVLDRSEVVGPPVRLVSNRSYLSRAVQFGFTEFQFNGDSTPVACRQGSRTFVWMPLGKDGALPPSDDAVRIQPQEEPPTPQPGREKEKQPKVKPSTNGKGHPVTPDRSSDSTPTEGSGLSGLIEEALALKEQARETCRRLTRLVTSLRRHRRQTRLMTSTLASLRQLQRLQPVDA